MSDQQPIDIGKPFDFRWMDEHNRIAAKYAGEPDELPRCYGANMTTARPVFP